MIRYLMLNIFLKVLCEGAKLHNLLNNLITMQYNTSITRKETCCNSSEKITGWVKL